MGSNMSRVVLAGEKVLHSIPTPTMATRGFFPTHEDVSRRAARKIGKILDICFIVL